jgi:hypothetical protein
MSLYTTNLHGGINIYAFHFQVAVTLGDHFYINPLLLNGRVRRGTTLDKKSAKLFCSLNWNFISCCPVETVEDRLIISCQGYTFELELQNHDDTPCVGKCCVERPFKKARRVKAEH